MILLDTNVLIRLHQIRLPDENLQISCVSLAELRFGIESAKSVEERNRRVREFAYVEEIIGAAWQPFDERAAAGAGFIAGVVAPSRPAHARSKDIMLAGHAYALGARVLTFNPKDFELVTNHVEIIVPERIR